MEPLQDRTDTKRRELEILFEEYKKNPALFERKSFCEDPETVQMYGIHIPGKEHFPPGYLKFMPQDFIVEEISSDGSIATVDYGEVGDIELPPDTPTIFATLVKCGLSTIEAIEEIRKQLGCDATQIQYAGIKDKDAITAQRISFRRIPLLKIKALRSPNFFLKDIFGGKGVMEKGNLRGNRFTVFMRLDFSSFAEETVSAFQTQLAALRENGFYNFYYLQRFGTPRLINIKWGLSILGGRYQEAVKSFLCESSIRELPYFQMLRQNAEKLFGNWTEMRKLFERFPLIAANELKVIRHLETRSVDFKGALATIPDQVTLWMYAVSSLLFNEKISNLVQRDLPIPDELPLLLSNIQEDVGVYKDLLLEMGLFPPPFQNLRPFPFIRLDHRTVKTKEAVEIHEADIKEEGIAISFSLSRGDYATTFLSHLFNLVTGEPPAWLDPKPVNFMTASGKGIEKTVEYFQSVAHSKKDNMFDFLK